MRMQCHTAFCPALPDVIHFRRGRISIYRVHPTFGFCQSCRGSARSFPFGSQPSRSPRGGSEDAILRGDQQDIAADLRRRDVESRCGRQSIGGLDASLRSRTFRARRRIFNSANDAVVAQRPDRLNILREPSAPRPPQLGRTDSPGPPLRAAPRRERDLQLRGSDQYVTDYQRHGPVEGCHDRRENPRRADHPFPGNQTDGVTRRVNLRDRSRRQTIPVAGGISPTIRGQNCSSTVCVDHLRDDVWGRARGHLRTKDQVGLPVGIGAIRVHSGRKPFCSCSSAV